MTLKLKNGWGIKPGRWETLQVGSNRHGVRVSFDQPGQCVRLYNSPEDPNGELFYLGVANATAENWQEVAHAYLAKRKVESPWEAE
jgi:hypothetical protein